MKLLTKNWDDGFLHAVAVAIVITTIALWIHAHGIQQGKEGGAPNAPASGPERGGK